MDGFKAVEESWTIRPFTKSVPVKLAPRKKYPSQIVPLENNTLIKSAARKYVPGQIGLLMLNGYKYQMSVYIFRNNNVNPKFILYQSIILLQNHKLSVKTNEKENKYALFLLKF